MPLWHNTNNRPGTPGGYIIHLPIVVTNSISREFFITPVTNSMSEKKFHHTRDE